MRKSRVAIALTGIIILALIAWYILFRPVQVVHWGRSYSIHQKNPYDLWLTHELLGRMLGGDSVITIYHDLESTLDTISDPGNATYVCIGQKAYYQPNDFRELAQFVDRGGTAFMSFENWFELSNLILDEEQEWIVESDFSFGQDTSWFLSIPSMDSIQLWDTLSFVTKNIDTTELVRPVFYLADSQQIFPDTLIREILVADDPEALCIAIPMGEGRFILHAAPLCFTNYFMREEAGKRHLEYLASAMPQGPVFWDEHSKLPFTNPPPRPSSYLDYILKHPALRWAWYLILAGALLYVLSQIRRRQRAIPVLKQIENTSIHYAETLGDLYFSTGDHLPWLKMRSELFWQGLRNMLNIQISTQSSGFTKEVASKSGIPISEIEAIKEKYTSLVRRPAIPSREVIAYEEKLQRILAQINHNETKVTSANSKFKA
ncbi:MAG: hypothetical protein KDC28_15520 [Saprospiraceae bacterium]|nr:hypothetical protein [Saprospiraceae bacterium]MCB9318558.1 hypothetical protein [Lewinellaceae bacterium]